MFSHIEGNDAVKAYLSRALTQDAVGNSLLFAGPENSNKELFAEVYSHAIISLGKDSETHCQKLHSNNHPDLHIYRPEGKIGIHTIQTMRQLGQEVHLPPYESDHKVFIIHAAERMLPFSSNALLKTFEEPPSDTVIILLSSHPELLLPTVLSRCRIIHFHPLKNEQKDVYSTETNPLTLHLLELLTQGKFESYNTLIAKAKQLAELIEVQSQAAEELLQAERLQGFTDKLTTLQREGMTKDLEGATAMHISRLAGQCFDGILEWHRDLLLLSVNGNPNLLFYPHSIAALKLALASGQMIPLDRLFKIIESAKLALTRSTALNLCFETLFLKLDLL